MSRRGILASAAIALALGSAPAARACPNCAEAMPPDGSARTAESYARSIYLLMGAPFVLTGAFVGGLVISARRRRRGEGGGS
ncbi:MAG: hypothetical protein KC466_16890 [Myxococcales bacterium]|nr:hypothetical protein [Myxococcales bacterium]